MLFISVAQDHFPVPTFALCKEPYATLAHLRLNKDLNLGPHD